MLTERIMGAIMFKREVYAEVEQDQSFTGTAWMIVVVVSLLSAAGSAATAGSIVGWLIGTVVGTIFGVIGFAVGAWVIAFVGKQLFQADVDFNEVVRTVGLAYVWRAVGFIGIVGIFGAALSCVVAPIGFVAALLGLAASLIAVKEALDLEWMQTIIVVVIGWVIIFIVTLIGGAIVAALGLAAGAAAGALGS
jgi:hypothetical protein